MKELFESLSPSYELKKRLEYLQDCRDEVSAEMAEALHKIDLLKIKHFDIREQLFKINDEIEEINKKLNGKT